MFFNKKDKKIKEIINLNKHHKGSNYIAFEHKENIIELKNIIKFYTTGQLATEVLKGVNLNIKHGEFVVILGPSGSGKTTLMNIISGLERATDGSINVLGNNLLNMSDEELTRFRRENIGYIFQQYGLLPNLKVKENIEIGEYLFKTNLKLEKKTHFNHIKNIKKENIKKVKHISKTSSKETMDKLNEGFKNEIESYMIGYQKSISDPDRLKTNYVDEIMHLLNIYTIKDKFPSELSGGQQQRVSIARSFAKKPNILFADEPTGAVDGQMSNVILESFKKINRDFKTTIIVVTHNPLIAELASKVVYFNHGIINNIIDNEKPKEVSEVRWE